MFEQQKKHNNEEENKIKIRLEKYHDALLRGRHPKSFPMKSSLFWSAIRDTDHRQKKRVTSKIFKEDEDTEMSEMHTTTSVTELPIYKRILEEDARAERILRHRKKNSALLDIYTGMFSSVEW